MVPLLALGWVLLSWHAGERDFGVVVVVEGEGGKGGGMWCTPHRFQGMRHWMH